MTKKFTLAVKTLILLTSTLLVCCSPQTYQLLSGGENFDALTKITNSKNGSISPSGGDEGKSLVFSVREEDGSYNIYLKDNVLANAISPKTTGNNFNLAPNYCRKTDRIVFQHFDKTNFDIYFVNGSKGKAITQVTNTDENEYNPNWSFDGKLITFEKGAPPKVFVKATSTTIAATTYTGVKVRQNQIWIKNLETSELKMIGQGSFPSFSPDGTKIVCVKYQLNKAKTQEIGTIWTMSIEGDDQKQITGSDLGYATKPCWSPNADKIVFQLTKNNKQDADIYMINEDGENLKQYTTNTSSDFDPYWSSDNLIYFSSDRGTEKEKFQIWRFKL